MKRFKMLFALSLVFCLFSISFSQSGYIFARSDGLVGVRKNIPPVAAKWGSKVFPVRIMVDIDNWIDLTYSEKNACYVAKDRAELTGETVVMCVEYSNGQFFPWDIQGSIDKTKLCPGCKIESNDGGGGNAIVPITKVSKVSK